MQQQRNVGWQCILTYLCLLNFPRKTPWAVFQLHSSGVLEIEPESSVSAVMISGLVTGGNLTLAVCAVGRAGSRHEDKHRWGWVAVLEEYWAPKWPVAARHGPAQARQELA